MRNPCQPFFSAFDKPVLVFSKAKGSGIGNDKRFPSMEETSRTCALFAYDAHQQL